MMTIDEMIRIKEESGLTIAQIAERSGVPLGTLGKIFSGDTKKPRTVTMRALEKALRSEDFVQTGKAARYQEILQNAGSIEPRSIGSGSGKPEGDPEAPRYYEIYNSDGSGSFFVRERSDTYGVDEPPASVHYRGPEIEGTSARWPKQGEYTVDDYLALPDDVRVELIDGAFFYMDAPGSLHQIISGEIFGELRSFVRSHKGGCRVISSPIDVQLDNDERTMVQPDVIVVCDRDKVHRRIHGAPDLVIEIISPSSSKKDRMLKSYKYGNAGVREYWIIDPYKKKVIVYDFENEEDLFIYGFGDKVPVRIWDGQCKIDFAEIYEEIRDLYSEEE